MLDSHCKDQSVVLTKFWLPEFQILTAHVLLHSLVPSLRCMPAFFACWKKSGKQKKAGSGAWVRGYYFTHVCEYIMILAQTIKSGDGVAYSMHSSVHYGQLGRVPIQTFISQTIP